MKALSVIFADPDMCVDEEVLMELVRDAATSPVSGFSGAVARSLIARYWDTRSF